MRDALQTIAKGFLEARKHPLKGHSLAEFIRHDAGEQVRLGVPAEYRKGLLVEGSPGKGNWATVPWIAIFNPAITRSATQGYYLVYLYSIDMERLYLSLNQGTTIVYEEFKSRYCEELSRRAELIRSRLGGQMHGVEVNEIQLLPAGKLSGGYKGHLAKGYEAGHALGFAYDPGNLPSEQQLAEDLARMVELYLKLPALGGTESLSQLDWEEFDSSGGRSVHEMRRYRYHRAIERNNETSREVKRVLGFICQGCDFDFERIYGVVGKEYIEAHHLTPISELPEGELVALDPKKDFAVLCANCHRIMHRPGGPNTLEELRSLHRVCELRCALDGIGKTSP